MHAVRTQTTHNTAQTQLVEAAGVEVAYRRFGRPAEVPLVMLQHFRGNLDNWDPALTGALVSEREVILVDYPGVGSSRGDFGPSIADTARQMIAFATARGESKPENLLYIMFAHTDTSQAKGMEFLGRFIARKEGRDAPTSDTARDAQYDAIVEWAFPDHSALQGLTGINRPTLIIQGDNDLMIPTKLSHLMAGLIPEARIRIYPDAAHGFLFQYPIEVAAEANTFLAR